MEHIAIVSNLPPFLSSTCSLIIIFDENLSPTFKIKFFVSEKPFYIRLTKFWLTKLTVRLCLNNVSLQDVQY